MRSFSSKLFLAGTALTTLTFAEEPAKTVQTTPFIEYNNRMFCFSTNQIGYERIKPHSIYAGIDIWYLSMLTSHNFDHLVGEIEFRMGYNFFYNGRDHFTPVGGIGYFQDAGILHSGKSNGIFKFRHFEESHIPGIFYGMGGFLYDHEFNTIFNMGLNLKAMLGGQTGSKKHHSWGSTVYGVDVGVPFTFRFGHRRHWDIRIEPFNVYMHGSQFHRNYFGFRGTVGYRF
ncbi:MAG: hypothetical protein JSR58_03000 [Verrucomicrobia bacterium]|nr:hypothetical protein [Verrucomicrobiota bacterium]